MNPASRWLSPLALWTSVLAGPAAWGFDLETSYALVHWTCDTRRIGMLHGITLATLVVTGLGGTMAWQAWRRSLDTNVGTSDERARAQFMALLGLGSSLLFATAIVAGSIPRWMLDACQ
jgi:uncharacterized protein YjeT (DUF2065 family)